MVWQEQTTQIVMLTNLIEDRKVSIQSIHSFIYFCCAYVNPVDVISLVGISIENICFSDKNIYLQ